MNGLTRCPLSLSCAEGDMILCAAPGKYGTGGPAPEIGEPPSCSIVQQTPTPPDAPGCETIKNQGLARRRLLETSAASAPRRSLRGARPDPPPKSGARPHYCLQRRKHQSLHGVMLTSGQGRQPGLRRKDAVRAHAPT